MRARGLYVIFGVFLLINCKDPITLDVEGGVGITVIDGKITTLPGPYKLTLGATAGISQKPNAISGAHAVLIDDLLGLSEDYIETEPGVYSAAGEVVKGIPGHSYHVHVELPNGKQYSSKPETIPDLAAVDTPTWEIGQRSDYVNETEVKINVFNIYVDTQLPNAEKDYYFRWNTEDVYMFEQTPVQDPIGGFPSPCFVSGYPDPQRITLFTTKGQRITNLYHLLVAQLDIDKSFLAKHAFTIYVSSTSEESYNYWKQVDKMVNRSGSIFDSPPAPIKGNLFETSDDAETVYGYFEASNMTLARFSVLRSQLKVVIPPYCNDGSRGLYWADYPPECRGCLSLPNSSKIPPDWF